MWPRKQLDISWFDFAFAAAQVMSPAKRLDDDDVAGLGWLPRGEALVSLSVRSAWDLLLSALQLPQGSEVIMSAVTVPDMARILRHHGLVPVPVDVDPARAEPVAAEIEHAITPRTRAILVAHLFGTLINMAPIAELASKHNLLAVEDCAQAFIGREYAGHAGSDVCLFSFGPIKTATALGGAVSRVRDPQLLAEMFRRQREYPLQTRRSYLSRIAKFIGIKLFTARPVYTAAVEYCRHRGLDYDRKIAGLARSFAKDRLFELIRRQPSTPLVKMLQWRIATFEGSTATRLGRRTERSARVASELPRSCVIGGENPTHTYWVFPIRTRDDSIVESLQAAGFDATRLSSLVIVAPGADEDAAPSSSQRLAAWLDETVFLPNCDAMPDAEFDRLATLLAGLAVDEKPAPHQKREPADRPRVILSP